MTGKNVKLNSWKRFLKTYNNKSTRKLYKNSLKKFFQFHYDETIDLEEVADQYLNSDRDFELDVIDFFNNINGEYSPKYIAVMRSAIRIFLEDNEIELPKRTWRRLAKSNPVYTIQEDRPPTRDELKKIFRFLPLHGKGIFLIMLSGGTRIGETLKIKPSDIDWNSEPLRIKLRGEYTKNKYPRDVFVSREAREVLEQWMESRDDYIKQRESKHYAKSSRRFNKQVFPMHRDTALVIWRNALRKAGLDDKDENTGVSILRPHTLRKYFRTHHGADVEVKEILMGHNGYLTKSYVRYTTDELREAYQKGMYGVEIFYDSKEINTLKDRIGELETQQTSMMAMVKTLFENNPNANVEMARFFVWYDEVFQRRLPDERRGITNDQLDAVYAEVLNR